MTLHRRTGEILAQQANTDPDRVADHFLASGDDRAAEWLIQAAKRAERSFAWMIAVDHYTRAVQELERQPGH